MFQHRLGLTAASLLVAGCATAGQDANRILAPAGEGIPIAAGVLMPLNADPTGMTPTG